MARLFESVMRPGGRTPPPLLAAYLERTWLDQPWADPEIPSLVYQGTTAGPGASSARTSDGSASMDVLSGWRAPGNSSATPRIATTHRELSS